MSQYERFTQEKRLIVASMLIFNPHQYRIAQQIKCSQSAISQELSRNSVKNVYDPKKAQELADSRRRTYKKIVLDDPKIKNFIEAELKRRRSPQQISILAKQNGLQVSKSSIYNYIDKNPELKKYRKHKKYRKLNHCLSSRHGIPERISITERPVFL